MPGGCLRPLPGGSVKLGLSRLSFGAIWWRARQCVESYGLLRPAEGRSARGGEDGSWAPPSVMKMHMTTACPSEMANDDPVTRMSYSTLGPTCACGLSTGPL